MDDPAAASQAPVPPAALQFGHDSSPWMTPDAVLPGPLGQRASIRPRLIAVDDVEVLAEDVSLGVASIRPRLIAVDDARFSAGVPGRSFGLQFGHDSSPWMTTRTPPGSSCPRRASIRPRLIAVDDYRVHVKCEDSPFASIRPRLIAVDDISINRDLHRTDGASIRPRLIAVDDQST